MTADTPSGHVCHNHGQAPDCIGTADPRFTMDFTDVKPGAYFHWCAVCGPEAHALDRALTNALATRPGFAAKLRAEIDKHEPS